MEGFKVGDVVRPVWVGRGKRSYVVVDVTGDTMIVQKVNVTSGQTYGEEKELSYSEIVARWEKAEIRKDENGVNLVGVAFTSRWGVPSERGTHHDWNHWQDPEGANKV